MAKASAQITLHYVIDIQATYRYYLLQGSTLSAPSKPTTYPPLSSWVDSEPSYTSGSTNSLYFVDCTVFCDDTFTYSAVSLSSSYEAAKAAYNKAANAESTANSAQESIDNLEIGGRNYIKGGKGDSRNGLFINFDTVDEDAGYAEHTLTSQKTHSSVDVAEGFVLGCRDYEVGKQVTFSYDIMFTAWDFPDGATRSQWWFGQLYTNQQTDSTDTTGEWTQVTAHTMPAVGTDCELNEWYHMEITKTIPVQAADGIGTTTKIRLYNSNADVSASVTFRIKNVKLEYGNRASDWTPAPEDMATSEEVENAQETANEANGKADDATDRLSEAEILIDSINSCITSLVTDENGTSLMTQTSDGGWTFSIADMQNSVNATSESLGALLENYEDTESAVTVLEQAVADLGVAAEYVKITTYDDEPCIELGESDSVFKVLITNTRIMFKEGSNTPTYISNKGLVTENIEVENEFRTGNWVWKVRSNGNLGLVWKESDE